MWSILIGVLSGIMLAWLILAAAIWLAKPDDLTLGDMIRLLPDLLRLLSGWPPTARYRGWSASS